MEYEDRTKVWGLGLTTEWPAVGAVLTTSHSHGTLDCGKGWASRPQQIGIADLGLHMDGELHTATNNPLMDLGTDSGLKISTQKPGNCRLKSQLYQELTTKKVEPGT